MMMRLILLLFLVMPFPAFAHLGHMGELAGHDHWVAGAAIGAAVVIGLLGAWKGRKEAKVDEPEETEESEA